MTPLKLANKHFSRKLKKIKPLKITEINFDSAGRFYSFTLFNKNLLEGKPLLAAIFKALLINKNFIAFGEYKIIILSVVLKSGEYYTLHPNILINGKTNFKDYWNKVNKNYKSFNECTYIFEDLIYFNVKVWNMDLYKNRKIKITKNATGFLSVTNYNKRSYHTSTLLNFPVYSTTGIKPLTINKLNSLIPRPFTTIDIETISDREKGTQIPVIISLHNWTNTRSRTFILDLNLFNDNPTKGINKLWAEFVNYLLNNITRIEYQTIFIHNLGGFDGYFIFKYLTAFQPENIKTLIDEQNRFILIVWKINKIKIKFLDSYRIFPVSLNELADKFDVQGKLNLYKSNYNNINILDPQDCNNTEFIEYAKQDSKTLFDALINAQSYYLDTFSSDITDIVSLPSLSLKIFRSNFLNEEIPLLKPSQDFFIRQGYYGGATDYYKAYIEKGKQYDINSLYSYAMLKNPMPHKIIKFHKNLDNIKLENFFGFILVKVTCPKTITRPMLPYKNEGKTIFPTGTWLGVYFSEELKVMVNLGYKIKLINGYEFTKIDLFSNYVNYFYNIKSFSIGSSRFLAKLHLNSLYGIFGRKLELNQIIIIKKKDLPQFMLNKVILKIIELNENYIAIKVSKNLNSTILPELNSQLETNFTDSFSTPVKSNVALAAAITAYARITMIPYKLMEGTAYSDTDCIFTTNTLPDHLVGKELGKMKDELEGNTISEAYFFGIKQYGFYFEDSQGNRVERSVFAGVERNSIPWNEVVDLFNGKTLTKIKNDVFFKSMKSLNIKIQDRTLNIKFKPDKILINNNYIPPHIYNPKLNKINKTNKLIKLIKQIWAHSPNIN
jgi:hypothetical protein